MSSRILRGVAADPIAWRALAAPAGPDAVPEANTDAHDLPARSAELEREAQAREQRSFSSGYAKGEVAGRAGEASRVTPAIANLTRAASELSAMRRKLRRDAEEDCVKLAVAIARRVLRRELTMDPDALLGIVKAALTRLEGRELERLRIHPDDAALVKRYLDEQGDRAPVHVFADPALERGTCIFETSRGDLDASVETQLQEIQRGLVDRIR
jgi:flagellar assembly protein FliH